MTTNVTFPSHEWVIDGLLEHGDRLILTGFEGVGKSSLLQQVAVCAAAGIHPFTHRPQPRQRVLLVDCENSERRVHRALQSLKETANAEGQETNGGLCTFFEPGGLDLGHQEARGFVDFVINYAPDLLIIGPLYRMGAADYNGDWGIQTVTRALDKVRFKTDCAVIIEAHPARAQQGAPRTVAPSGSSLLLRWPDFGIGLVPADEHGTLVQLKHWRGPREERAWPNALRRSSAAGWRWTAMDDVGEDPWANGGTPHEPPL